MMNVTHINEDALYTAVDRRLRDVARHCERHGQHAVACQILDALDVSAMPVGVAITIWRTSVFRPLDATQSSPTGWVVAMEDRDGNEIGGWTYSDHTGHLLLTTAEDGAP